jgi:hypothetical protein
LPECDAIDDWRGRTTAFRNGVPDIRENKQDPKSGEIPEDLAGFGSINKSIGKQGLIPTLNGSSLAH